MNVMARRCVDVGVWLDVRRDTYHRTNAPTAFTWCTATQTF
jgi:hypothetical protein